MWNIVALILIIQKLLAWLIFQPNLQNYRMAEITKTKSPDHAGIENEIEGATVHLKGYAERCILIIPFWNEATPNIGIIRNYGRQTFLIRDIRLKQTCRERNFAELTKGILMFALSLMIFLKIRNVEWFLVFNDLLGSTKWKRHRKGPRLKKFNVHYTRSHAMMIWRQFIKTTCRGK